MIAFPETPELLAKGDYKYFLLKDYIYEWVHEGSERKLVINRGLETDLASTPKLVWWLIGKQDLGLAPPLIHDALYRSGGDLSSMGYGASMRKVDGEWQETEPWTREQADRLFCRQMRELDVSIWKRRTSFWAVRVFGFFAWRHHDGNNNQD